jgi:NagD protein
MTEYGFLLDMDGVIYRGPKLIAGAADFIKLLRRRNIPFLFLTNNSQRARRDVAHKLSKMGIPTCADDVFTCGIATARYLARRRPGGTAYVIGENGLTSALFKNGYTVVDDDADFVVVGEGRTMSFEMIEKGVRLVEKGAKLIATNLDPSCPTDKGIRPGCGAIVSMIEKATGKRAFSVGKPSPVMMRAARKQLGLATDQTVMVGDTMSTDILGGNQMGYQTVLVLSGGTREEDLDQYAYSPDFVVPSIAHIPQTLLSKHKRSA